MPQFDAMKYAYPSHRNVVFARKGMACSVSPVASQVGLEILKSGGNAMDAAIAMAVTLPLVEPTGNGLGADCFALVWSAKDQKLYGLDGSGVAPTLSGPPAMTRSPWRDGSPPWCPVRPARGHRCAESSAPRPWRS